MYSTTTMYIVQVVYNKTSLMTKVANEGLHPFGHLLRHNLLRQKKKQREI